MANYKPANLCEMKEVESSQISRVGYVPATEDSGYLFVDFSKTPGKKNLYMYHPIPKDIYESMMNSESKGHYFHVVIKNNPLISCVKIPD